jgi:membrane dipeptidase
VQADLVRQDVEVLSLQGVGYVRGPDRAVEVAFLVGVRLDRDAEPSEGVGDGLPAGLKDVSGYRNIVQALLEKGYSKKDIRKICGENLLRVWSEVERVAAEPKAG